LNLLHPSAIGAVDRLDVIDIANRGAEPVDAQPRYAL
jgi:hypothetical protein